MTNGPNGSARRTSCVDLEDKLLGFGEASHRKQPVIAARVKAPGHVAYTLRNDCEMMI
jgi:hypothetical protein